MRSLIHELPYEQPLAAGLLRYERDGRATGAVEHWQLTAAVEGYRFLRVDLDARDAASGESTLFHLTLNPGGRPERLRFRFFGPGCDVNGHLLFDEGRLTLSRVVNRVRHEEEMALLPGYAFWFPSTIGLGLLAGNVDQAAPLTAVTLHKATHYGLHATEVTFRHGEAGTLRVGRDELPVRLLDIRWQAQQRLLWLDEAGWPLKMKRGDGLTAVETRYIRYVALTPEEAS
jgi:hypothetical protein